MKPSILLLAFFAVVFSSCSSAYKTGQTPDDVYYSPTRPQDEYVRVNNDNDDQRYYGDDYYDNRYLRMKVQDPALWSELDDWYYYGDRYNYSYNYFTNYGLYLWNNPWSPYTYWNNYYNPYYQSYVILNPKTSLVYSHPRTVNLNTFNNNRLVNRNSYIAPYNSRTSNNSYYNKNSGNSNRNTGSFLRSIFSNGNSGNSPSTSSRSSGSSGSSGGSKGSTSAPVRKF